MKKLLQILDKQIRKGDLVKNNRNYKMIVTDQHPGGYLSLNGEKGTIYQYVSIIQLPSELKKRRIKMVADYLPVLFLAPIRRINNADAYTR